MKAKKLPSTLLRYSLVAGASLIIGFMSFGSMYSLLPLLPLAVVSFIWAVVYEGEIFSQNLRNGFKKLFQKDYLERYLGKQFLARLYQKQHALFDESDTPDSKEAPLFFRDYGRALKSLEAFAHQPLNSADKTRKAFIKRTLRDMEYWFAKQVFTARNHPADEDEEEDSAFVRYRQYMQAFLQDNKQEKWQTLLERRRKMYYATVAFCILVAGFTGLGTTWLLMEAFSILPFLAGISGPLLPALIIPMSVFAGIAYGLLTYNNVTDMINNKTVQRWYKKVVEAFQKPSWKSGILVLSALLLTALAVTLTVFTAGTWWTVAKTATPLFSAMRHIPTIVIGLFTGLGALFFNLENTSETLGMLEDAMPEKGNPLQWMWAFIVKTTGENWELLKKTWEQESWGQRLNPARALLLISGLPSRLASFIVHMLSMGLGDARTPGVPMVISGTFNVIGEAPELHMFFSAHDCAHGHDHHDHHDHDHDHDHGHEHAHAQKMQRHPLPAWLRSKPGHSHEGDLPSRMLKWAMLPVYVLAAVWDRAFGGMDDAVDAFERHWGSTPLSAWKEALSDWWHQLRNPENATAAVNADSIPAIACEPGLSHAWQQTQVDFRIEQFKVRHLNAVVGSKTAAEKREALTALQQSVKNALDADSIDSAVRSTFQDESINAHRFFASSRPTATRGFVEALPAKVLMPQSA